MTFGFESHCRKPRFGTLAIPFTLLCQCLSEETLSGVYARGSKKSHQSALECVTVVDSTTHSKLPPPPLFRPLWHWCIHALYRVLSIITQDMTLFITGHVVLRGDCILESKIKKKKQRPISCTRAYDYCHNETRHTYTSLSRWGHRYFSTILSSACRSMLPSLSSWSPYRLPSPEIQVQVYS